MKHIKGSVLRMRLMLFRARLRMDTTTINCMTNELRYV